jgi:hypothetical protein
MTIGANSNRDELVKTLRGMQFSKLDLRFLTGEQEDGTLKEGYDSFGKFKYRFGWGIGVGVSVLYVLILMASFGAKPEDFDDPTATWIRDNASWTTIVWAAGSYLLWRTSSRTGKVQEKVFDLAIENNDLKLLNTLTTFPPDLADEVLSKLPLGKSGVGTSLAFELKSKDNFQIAFGSTSHWWDPYTKPKLDGRYWWPTDSLFVYVAIPSLSDKLVFLTPSNQPVWEELPPMSEKAKTTLKKLSSMYAVAFGAGGIGVGYAGNAMNGVDTTLDNYLGSTNDWKILYNLLSREVADLVEGLEI